LPLSKRNKIILTATLVLILLIQLLRLNLGLNLDTMMNHKDFIFSSDKVMTLSHDELQFNRKMKGLIIDPNASSLSLLNIIKVMQDMQIDPATTITVPGLDELAAYDLIVIVGQNHPETPGFSVITDYVSQGGRLLYLSLGSLETPDILKNKSFFGVESLNSRQTVDVLNFKTELLSGLTGDLSISGIPALAGKINANLTHLTSDCQVHLSGGQNIPLIWERAPDGHVMVVNTGAYDSRMMRGLLTGAISVLLDIVIYPIIGSSVWQITDMPVDDQHSADVLSENYNRNFSRFILDIWWSDMSALLKKYRLKPTVSYVGSLADRIDKPFVSPRLSDTNVSNIFRSVVRLKGEFSFQGYNNLPLQLANPESTALSTGWSDMAEIAEALNCSLDFLNKLLPNYALETFVPSDFCLDEQSLSAIRNSMPNLKTICGAFDASLSRQTESASSVYVQDFSADEPYALALPLVTQRCFFDDATRFAMASAITTHGIINHRIAADEILEPENNNGLRWEALFDEYSHLLDETTTVYSWLSPDTAGTAGEKLRQAESLDVYFQLEDKTLTITCDHFIGDARVLLVSEKSLRALEGCDIIRVDSIRYLVLLHSQSASLEVISE